MIPEALHTTPLEGLGEPRLQALAVPEQLLLLALRKRAEGEHTKSMLRNVLRVLFGLQPLERATWAFEIVFRTLAGCGRETIAFRDPHSDAVSLEELALLELVAANDGARGEEASAIAEDLGLMTSKAPFWRALRVLARLMKGCRRIDGPRPGSFGGTNTIYPFNRNLT